MSPVVLVSLDWIRPGDPRTGLGTASIAASLRAAGVPVEVVADAVMASGATAAVPEGGVVAFGGDPWVLTEPGPPVALARCGDRVRAAEGGLLGLPSDARPDAVVFHDGEGWVVERDEATAAAGAGPVVLGDDAWVLHLPVVTPETLDVSAAPELPDLTLEFAVSRDEEYVELTLPTPVRALQVPARAHHYALLVLARARLADAESGDLEPSAHGWLDRSALCQMLGVEPARLKVDLYRCRRDLAVRHVRDAPALVESRRLTQQVRLGTGKVAVRAL
ncbi:MAG: hypothetical protein ACI9K2_000945 [Myxococcota bacterium]|jgi:hypothetical protein